MPPTAARPRILSGVQPSGRLHLGNYFGAIRRHVELQRDGDCFYFIADYHALTTIRDAAQLRDYSREVAIAYLAVGLDPVRATFYRQSDVPEVTELAWLLATATGMGLLEKAHSYKEKVAKGLTPNVGLFFYPALMAADILAPQADLVPVGQDQEQHVEITRDVAQAFEAAFRPRQPVFKLPKASFGPTPRVPGTSFEKGSVLQVTTELALPVDAGEYVQTFRVFVPRLLAEAADGVQTTEQLEARIAAEHPRVFPGVQVLERQLRTLAEMPTQEIAATPRRDVGRVVLEFSVPIERVLFQTRNGRRIAAKMSKSYGNTIDLFAEGKALKKAVMGIETRLVDLAQPIDPDEDIVLALYRLVATPAEALAVEQGYRAGGYGFGRAKQELLGKLDECLAPFRDRKRALEQDPDLVEDVLREGAAKARTEARRTLDAARAACGLSAASTAAP
jgi:tryptophanyl-tRNA synthetase